MYTSPSSLECKRATLPKASQPHARLYQVPSSWCAGSMTRGEVHIHKSNCTVVAVDDVLGVVYMTCVTGSPGHKITQVGDVKVVNMHSALVDGKVKAVEEVKGRCIHWVMLDEADMRLLTEKGQGMRCYVLLCLFSLLMFKNSFAICCILVVVRLVVLIVVLIVDLIVVLVVVKCS